MLLSETMHLLQAPVSAPPGPDPNHYRRGGWGSGSGSGCTFFLFRGGGGVGVQVRVQGQVQGFTPGGGGSDRVRVLGARLFFCGGGIRVQVRVRDARRGGGVGVRVREFGSSGSSGWTRGGRGGFRFRFGFGWGSLCQAQPPEADDAKRLKLDGYICFKLQPKYNVGATYHAGLRLGPQGLHLGEQGRLGGHLNKMTYDSSALFLCFLPQQRPCLTRP